MQKKIIALAVAGLVSGAAFAQSNVTLYGRIDLGYTYSKSDYKKFQGIEAGNGINGGQARLGFMGEEGLGNGLKAVFKFEWGFASDLGSGPTAARYTYVGLAGKFGSVLLGRNGTPSDFYAGATGAMGINGYEPINLLRGNVDTELVVGTRWNNSIAYSSPNFSGLDFTAIYSFGEKVSGNKAEDAAGNTLGYACNPTAGADVLDNNGTAIGKVKGAASNCKSADTSDAGKFGIGARYANGPLYLFASYEARADDDSAKTYGIDSNTGYGAKGWALGGAYDFKVVKVYANYFRVKHNNHGRGLTEGTDKRTAWSLGVSAPVSGAGTVVAEYAQYKDTYLAGDPVVNGVRVDYGDKAKGYSVGYKHTLSKRTSLYTYLTRINNDKGFNAGWSKTGVAGENQTTFTAGLLHVF
jgi:predicted porin